MCRHCGRLPNNQGNHPPRLSRRPLPIPNSKRATAPRRNVCAEQRGLSASAATDVSAVCGARSLLRPDPTVTPARADVRGYRGRRWRVSKRTVLDYCEPNSSPNAPQGVVKRAIPTPMQTTYGNACRKEFCNATQLYRELQEQGYDGAYLNVYKALVSLSGASSDKSHARPASCKARSPSEPSREVPSSRTGRLVDARLSQYLQAGGGSGTENVSATSLRWLPFSKKRPRWLRNLLAFVKKRLRANWTPG